MLPWLAVVAAVASYVVHVVGRHTIEVVRARALLPKWDLATHLCSGWVDYYLLVTGRIHQFLWDLWMQGYWPPGHSLFQIPFYAVLGGEMASGLWSSAAAFVLVVTIGAALLLRQPSGSSVFAASVFVALLITSPYMLAFASLAMTEMVGALAQLLVLFCYAAWRERRSARSARLFAISLTVLFFVKYNYFLLLAVPLVVYEWLERTAGWPLPRRMGTLWGYARRILSSPTSLFVLLYLTAVLLVMRTGGFEFHLLGHRVSVRSIGNSGHIVLYLLLLRLWYLHRRSRIDWRRLTAADERVRPLLVWFVLPVTIWLASPYPNHIRDFVSLVVNRGPTERATGSDTYLYALRFEYFYDEWVLAALIAAVVSAVLCYRRHAPPIRLAVVAVLLQSLALALHVGQDARFLLQTVVLTCLAAAAEVGRWVPDRTAARLTAGLVAPIVLTAGVLAAHHVVTEDRFRSLVFGAYTDSGPLRAALAEIRRDLAAGDRLLVVGQSDQLSPALFRWELGPPSGVPCFPFQIGGAGRLHPALATRILLLVPLDSRSPLETVNNDPARFRAILDDVARGALVLRREFPLPDLHVALRLYARTSPPPRLVTC